MKCLQCNSENEQGSKFCSNCGAALILETATPPSATPAPPPAQVFCQSCGAPNEEGSGFCVGCGASLEAVGQTPPAATPAPPPAQVFCQSCGAPNAAGRAFCSKCGARLEHQAGYARAMQKETSWAWWLLPIIFLWLGGLISWLAIRHDDEAKAKRIFQLGIGLTTFFSVLAIIAAATG